MQLSALLASLFKQNTVMKNRYHFSNTFTAIEESLYQRLSPSMPRLWPCPIYQTCNFNLLLINIACDLSRKLHLHR